MAMSSQSGKVILFCEDEVALRKLCARILEKEGYQVLAAHSQLEAVSFAEQFSGSIHLLVTDVRLPEGSSGYKLAELVRCLRPEIRVLYISGYPSERYQQDSATFLGKPFSPPELIQRVNTLLDATCPAT